MFDVIQIFQLVIQCNASSFRVEGVVLLAVRVIPPSDFICSTYSGFSSHASSKSYNSSKQLAPTSKSKLLIAAIPIISKSQKP